MPDTTSPTTATAKKSTVRKSAASKKEGAIADLLSPLPASTPKKRAPRKAGAAPEISPEEKHHLISVAAYFIAERSCTPSGSPHDDWLQAEREIDAMIAAGKFTA
jgi:hypothetical protein